MRVYGNLINRIMEEAGSPAPTVGMGATMYCFSDRRPFTVIEVRGRTIVKIQEDNAVRIDKNGMSECQDYEFSLDPNGSVSEVRKGRDGTWRVKGGGSVVRFGKRDKYYDYIF